MCRKRSAPRTSLFVCCACARTERQIASARTAKRTRRRVNMASLLLIVSSLDNDLVGEDPRVAAVTGVPCGDLAEVHSLDANVTRFLARDVFDEVFRECADVDGRIGAI